MFIKAKINTLEKDIQFQQFCKSDFLFFIKNL